MSAAATKIDWRKEPTPGHFEMTQDGDFEPTIFPASDSYNRDRASMAAALDCEYIEVRMETYWMVWAPEEAEARWRQDRCECEDGPHYPGRLFSSETGEEIAPEECATTKPAEDIWDFWDEGGYYCPWSRCKASTPGAVKFRRGEIRPPEKHSKEGL